METRSLSSPSKILSPSTLLVLGMTVSTSWLVVFSQVCVSLRVSGLCTIGDYKEPSFSYYLPFSQHLGSTNKVTETLRTQSTRKIVNWCDKVKSEIWRLLKEKKIQQATSKPKHCDCVYLPVKNCNIVISKTEKLHLFVYFQQEENFFLT